MIDLNDGNWEVLLPESEMNRKLHSLDDLDGPTNKELNDIVNEESIDKILEELNLDDYLWNLN
jgi:hypothetical protein|tara:strand:- start:2231 stop:2419 length:189 start_codon:yes stop_codon:yes gene_type:complete